MTSVESGAAARMREMGVENSRLDIRGLVGVLRRQIRLIIYVSVAVMIIASVVVFSLKPTYLASTLIIVDTNQTSILNPENGFSIPTSDSERVESEVELASSRTVFVRAVKDANLESDPALASEPDLLSRVLTMAGLKRYAEPTPQERFSALLGKLAASVSVERRGVTSLIEIQAKSPNQNTAATIANAVAKAYIAEQLEAKINSRLAARDIIQSRLDEAGATVAASEDAFDNYVGDNIDAIAKETGNAELRDLYSRISSEAAARSALASKADKAELRLRDQDWAGLADTLGSGSVSTLVAEQRTLRDRISATANGTEEAINLRSELQGLNARIADTARSEVTSLRNEVSKSQASSAELSQRLRAGVLASQLSSATLTRIYALQQSSEIARSQYQALLTRLKDLEQEAYVQVPDSRIVAEALPPDAPSFPNPRLLLSLAAVAALVAGIALAFLYENYVGGIVHPDQLVGITGLKNVVTIPKQRDSKHGDTLADVLVSSPLSVYSESIRRVRIAVDRLLRQTADPAKRRGRVILVSSAAPNEGKTTVSLSLARTYALAGKTTLLIDCDLRRPSVHRQLGIEPAIGLLDYLSGQAGTLPLTSIVSIDGPTQLGVLVGSRRSDKATDQLVSGAEFNRLIERVVESFDIVILDTPPIGLVVDGAYLAQNADVVVYIVTWASTPQQEVRSGVQTFLDVMPTGSEMLLVINQSESSQGSYAGKYAEYYTEA